MINGKKIIAIIPARAGSKGLPGKNIRNLCGKPLISWTIESALESKYIDTVVVSTDSEEIAKISHFFGATVPFIRPVELATDDAKTFDVLMHALEHYAKLQNKSFDYLILLEPTSPLRERYDIDLALEKLLNHPTAQAIVSISRTESQNPEFLLKIRDDESLVGFCNKQLGTKRRQEIDNVYFLEGSIYISEINSLILNKSFFHERTIGIVVPKWKSLEVDDFDDFVMIEALMNKRILNK